MSEPSPPEENPAPSSEPAGTDGPKPRRRRKFRWMYWCRRAHLYLGTFFTPLLLFYILTGWYQTVNEDRLKDSSEAETFLQKARAVHTDAALPVVVDEEAAKKVEEAVLNVLENLPDGDQETVLKVEEAMLRALDSPPDGDQEAVLEVLENLPRGDAEAMLAALEKLPQSDGLKVKKSDPRAFKFLAVLMCLMATVAIALGLFLSFKTLKQKWLVVVMLAVGFLLPWLMLKLGQP